MRSLVYDINHWPLWRTVLKTWGFSMVAPTLDRQIYLYLHRIGIMGVDEKKMLHRLIRPGMQILDIGANIGLYALWMAQCAGANGRVCAFEPVPLLFRSLEESCRLSSVANVEPFNVALGIEAGEAAIHERAFNSGDGRMSRSNRSPRSVRVQVRRGDEVLRDRSFDLIKMDVQGFELHVLRGLEEVIRRSAGAPILFEYWPNGLRAAGTEPASLAAHLLDAGYSIYAPDGERRFIRVRPEEMLQHTHLRPWGHSGNFLARIGEADTYEI